MENRSQNNQNRRPSGNRSGGRSRNRQGNQSSSGGSDSGGRSRSRNRNRSGSKPKAPEQTAGQKILSILTFGILGKPKPKSRSGSAAKGARKPETAAEPRARAPKTDTVDRPKRNGSEVTSGRLYVGNLDYSTGEVELESLFRGVGNVLSAEVVTNPRTQQSKGFAFVEMGSIDEAKRAVSVLDDQDFMGRKLIVSGARSDGPHDESDDESAMAESSSSQHG
jgi:hypothetical protein